MPPTEKTHTAEAKQEATHTPFSREARYVVIKIKDAKEYLGLLDYTRLWEISDRTQRARLKAGKELLDCVVIEKDWPEFGPAWSEIEARMTGKLSSHAALLARNEEMREALSKLVDRDLTYVGGYVSDSQIDAKDIAFARDALARSALALPPMEGREA